MNRHKEIKLLDANVSSRIKKSFWGLMLLVVVIGLILLRHGYSRSIYDLICVILKVDVYSFFIICC